MRLLRSKRRINRFIRRLEKRTVSLKYSLKRLNVMLRRNGVECGKLL